MNCLINLLHLQLLVLMFCFTGLAMQLHCVTKLVKFGSSSDRKAISSRSVVFEADLTTTQSMRFDWPSFKYFSVSRF